MRMNLPEYHGSKVNKDPVKFINKAYHIVAIIGVPLNEKAELVAYQLKGMPKV